MAKIFWFTGLSGAGKSTVASETAARLRAAGKKVRILDGDDVRNRLHRHLGFSTADILENNRLIAELCIEARDGADAILVPIISPLDEARAIARALLGADFRLVYFSAPLSHVERADVKGLYEKARTGAIDNMIGVADTNPYEPPSDADLEIDISAERPERSAKRLFDYIRAELDGK